MATHDYVIANGTGAAVRSDLNGALAAIVSQNSSATEPSPSYAYQRWADTTAGVMKMRNGANNAWISLYELDGTFLAGDISLSAGAAATPSLFFTGDTNTGIYSPGADQVGISTGGTARITVDASGNVNIDSNTLYVDAANNRVGVNTITPLYPMHVVATTDGPQILLLLANNSQGGTNETAALQLSVTGTAGGSACKVIAGKESDHSSSANIDSFLQFTTTENDAEAVRVHITAAGKVGFGTTGPGGTVDIKAAASTAPLILQGPSSEFARIDSSGRLLVGQTGTGLQAARSMAWQGSGEGALYISHSTSDISGDAFVKFGYNAGQIGSITQNGTTAVAYNTSSDYRLKENVTPVPNGITRLLQLKPSRFNFIADPDRTVDGFIAHEVQATVPEAITGEKDAVDEDGKPVYQGIDQSKLVPLLTAALQEAIARIETLEARLSALEGA